MNVHLTKELHTIPEEVSTSELHLHDRHIEEEGKGSSYSRKKEKTEGFRASPYAEQSRTDWGSGAERRDCGHCSEIILNLFFSPQQLAT